MITYSDLLATSDKLAIYLDKNAPVYKGCEIIYREPLFRQQASAFYSNEIAAHIIKLLDCYDTFVDVFGSNVGIFLKRPVAKVTVYNDIHGNVFNFLKILEKPKEFLDLITRIPPNFCKKYLHAKNPSDLMRAVYFYESTRQIATGYKQGKFYNNIDWGNPFLNHCVGTLRATIIDNNLVQNVLKKYSDSTLFLWPAYNFDQSALLKLLVNKDFLLVAPKDFASKSGLFYQDLPDGYVLASNRMSLKPKSLF